MKNGINIPLIFLLAMLLFNCGRKESANEKNNVQTLDIFSESTQKLTFQSIRMVPLETGEDILIGGRSKLKVHNDEFYVLDKENHDCVLRFNSEGKFLNKIGKHGKGPREYRRADDFSIHGDTIDFLDGGTQTTITGYRKNGDFLYSKTFDVYARSFEKTENGYAIYSSYNSQSPFRLKTTDENGNIKNTYLKSDSKLKYPVPGKLLRFGSLIYFQEGYHHSTYILESGNLKKTYTFDFGKYSIPKAFFNMDSRKKRLNMIHKKGFASIRCYFGNKTIDVFEVLTIKKNQDSKAYHVVYERQKNQLFRKKFNIESKEYRSFKQPVSITRNRELIYLSNAYTIKENKENLKDLVVNDEPMNGLEQNDNPVVLFCEI